MGNGSWEIIIWYKRENHNYISYKKEKTYIWLKISRELHKNTKDMYLSAIYLPPSSSPYYFKEYLHKLQKEILHFQSLGSLLSCGDFNARTVKEKAFIDIDDNNHYIIMYQWHS